MYQQHVQRQQEVLAVNSRPPPHLPRYVNDYLLSFLECHSMFIVRSPMLPGDAAGAIISEVEDPMGSSPPLELRGSRITSVPLSLQSPGDRATGKLSFNFI